MTRRPGRLLLLAVVVPIILGLIPVAPAWADGPHGGDPTPVASAPADPGDNESGEHDQPSVDLREVPKPAATSPATAPAKRPKPKLVASSQAVRAVQLARSKIGSRYVYGAEGPGVFDCSGLVKYVYGRAGVRLPRIAKDQAKRGSRVTLSQIRPGDLVVMRRGRHIGVYIGGGRVIHASSSKHRVVDASLAMLRETGYVDQIRRVV